MPFKGATLLYHSKAGFIKNKEIRDNIDNMS